MPPDEWMMQRFLKRSTLPARALFSLSLAVQSVASVEERGGDPGEDEDEWIRQQAREEPEEHRRRQERRPGGHHDASFDGLEHAPVRERRADCVPDSDCSRSGPPGTSSAALGSGVPFQRAI